MKRETFVIAILGLFWWVFSEKKVPQNKRMFPAPTSVSKLGAQSRIPAESLASNREHLSLSISATKGSSPMSRTYEYTEELQTYNRLNTKPFLSADEEKALEDLVAHGGLLQSLDKVLLKPAWSEQSILLQDAAIDLLLTALRGASAASAAATLRSVVEDRQVEDPSVDAKTREQLAGLKAEVLYLWSAQAPEMAANIQSWLPGPVSLKIWSNVQRMQRANQAESEAESRDTDH